jgi:2-methylcitrate dehydratase PrpD
MDATYEFVRNFVTLTYEDLPSQVVEVTKKQILDLLGIAVRGACEPGVKELTEIITEWGGKEESSIIGLKQKVPAPNAAQLNASMAHALDYDDVHETAIIHPGVTIIPTCMAIAEQKGNLSGTAFITCAALGVDMISRLALATTPGESPIKTGWHLTSLYGFIGAAAAAGKMLGLDEARMINGVGIAYHQCAGNGQCVKDGALTKRLGPGFSVKGGITAALMAEKGVTGAKNCLEGEMGLYNIYFQGRYDRKVLLEDLGKSFEGLKVAIKPYPCCRGVHPAIDAALALVNETPITAENISQIKVAITEDMKFLLCSPLDAKCRPRNPVDAQFSIPWGIASAIVRKRVTLADFTEAAIAREDVLSVAGKIAVEVDNTLKQGDKLYPARVEITTKQGERYFRQVNDPLGSLERPMSFNDCAEKFRDCVGSLKTEQIEKAIDLIGNLEKVTDIRVIFDLLCKG